MKLFYSVTNNLSANPPKDIARLLATCAAEEGLPFAQSFLGYCYKSGFGVKQDDTKAYQWSLKAAKQGDTRAQNYVGYALSSGAGVKENVVAALQWYIKARRFNSSVQCCVVI
jgi:uncharacterized protein